jgi:hypothetical protein
LLKDFSWIQHSGSQAGPSPAGGRAALLASNSFASGPGCRGVALEAEIAFDCRDSSGHPYKKQPGDDITLWAAIARLQDQRGRLTEAWALAFGLMSCRARDIRPTAPPGPTVACGHEINSNRFPTTPDRLAERLR